MAVGRRATPPAAGDATKLTPGARGGIAVAVFVVAVIVSGLVDHFVRPLPQPVIGAWAAAAAIGGAVLALTLPWRGAAGLALTCALITGTLTYSHPAREKAAVGVEMVGSTVGGWMHHHGKGSGG